MGEQANEGLRTGPLRGIKVLDFSIALTGPYATALMADQGAHVVKVERPGIGDIARWVGEEVHEDARDAARLVEAMGKLSAAPEGPGWTVMHGDAHVGNILIAPDGKPSLVDWQLVQRNFYGIDVGYHIASALTTEDREKAERDLVQHYLDELRAFGVAGPPSWDEMWDAYRVGNVYGFFMWGITKIVLPPKIKVLLQRLSAAVAAHDGFAAVGV